MMFEGADRVSLSSEGNLVLRTDAGSVAARVFPSPVAISATMPFRRAQPPMSWTS